MNYAIPRSAARSMSLRPKMDSSSIIGTRATLATASAAAQSSAAQGYSKSSIPSGSASAAKRHPSSAVYP